MQTVKAAVAALALSSLLTAAGAQSVTDPLGVGRVLSSGDTNGAPGTPNEVEVRIKGPRTLDIHFHNTAGSRECVRFEFSTKVDGKVVSPDENPARPFPESQPTNFPMPGTACTKDTYVTRPMTNLDPEREYCFQIWARNAATSLRSNNPSAWACGRTLPNAPLAPLDVRAVVASADSTKPPRVSWNTPDQSGHRGITRFTIERQSPPGPSRPWVAEGTVQGPGGAQSATTKLAFSFDASPVNAASQHVYRVCAENDGGRACAQPVALQTAVDRFGSVGLNEKVAVGAAGSTGTLGSLSAEQKAALVRAAANAPQSPASPAPAPSAAGNAGTLSSLTPQQRTALVRAATQSTASPAPTAPVGTPVPAPSMTPAPAPAQRAAPAPSSPATAKSGPANVDQLVRNTDLPATIAQMNDNAIIIVGGRQLRAGEVKAALLALDDTTALRMGGQPTSAGLIKQQLRHGSRPGSLAELKGNQAALNPQPLPPKAQASGFPAPQPLAAPAGGPKAPASSFQR